MMICIYKKKSISLEPKNIQTTCVATGNFSLFGKKAGNKGSVIISFIIMNQTFCFIGAHLAAF